MIILSSPVAKSVPGYNIFVGKWSLVIAVPAVDLCCRLANLKYEHVKLLKMTLNDWMESSFLRLPYKRYQYSTLHIIPSLVIKNN